MKCRLPNKVKISLKYGKKSLQTSLLNEFKSWEAGNTKAAREFQSLTENEMTD